MEAAIPFEERRPLILQLPGWQGSGSAHWQTLWQEHYGDVRVEQDDWLWPRRGDWIARLEEVVQQQSHGIVLVAHSLGCHLVATWAAHSTRTARIKAAMLVAPPDTQRPDTPPQLFSWQPMQMTALPFPALMITSDNDPFCTPKRSRDLATAWNAVQVDIGSSGHINDQSNLGQWPEGRRHLLRIIDLPQPHIP